MTGELISRIERVLLLKPLKRSKLDVEEKIDIGSFLFPI